MCLWCTLTLRVQILNFDSSYLLHLLNLSTWAHFSFIWPFKKSASTSPTCQSDDFALPSTNFFQNYEFTPLADKNTYNRALKNTISILFEIMQKPPK